MEIIPNWHPIFVHFTVALLSVAALLMLGSYALGGETVRDQLRLVARWNIWIGAVFVVFTVLTGVLAYNSVTHDTPSHAAMTDHRNWALVTAGLFLLIATWLGITVRGGKVAGALFVVVLLIATGLLGITAWKGGELVYRYGLGVMSLPRADTHGHADGESHDHGTVNKAEHDNSDGHHDNLDGHHDKLETSTGSTSAPSSDKARDDHFADGHTH